MFNQNLITKHTTNPSILAFAKFVADNVDLVAPINVEVLMSVPKLASNTFIISVAANGEPRLRFRYSGTKLDQEYGSNLMGKNFENVYDGTNRPVVIENLYDVIAKPGIGFIRQEIIFEKHGFKYRTVERLAFPVKSREGQVDEIIGFVNFENRNDSVNGVSLVLDC